MFILLCPFHATYHSYHFPSMLLYLTTPTTICCIIYKSQPRNVIWVAQYLCVCPIQLRTFSWRYPLDCYISICHQLCEQTIGQEQFWINKLTLEVEFQMIPCLYYYLRMAVLLRSLSIMMQAWLARKLKNVARSEKHHKQKANGIKTYRQSEPFYFK